MDHSWGSGQTWRAEHELAAYCFSRISHFTSSSASTPTQTAASCRSRTDMWSKGRFSVWKEARGIKRVRERYATVELTLVDSADREWKLNAKGMTTFPWQCWPNMVSFNVLGRWQCGNLTGYGEIQDFFEMPQLTALNANSATRALASRRINQCCHAPSFSTSTAHWCRRGRRHGSYSQRPNRFPGSGISTQQEFSSFWKTTCSTLCASVAAMNGRQTRRRSISGLLESEYNPEFVPGMCDVVKAFAGNCSLAVISSNAVATSSGAYSPTRMSRIVSRTCSAMSSRTSASGAFSRIVPTW